MISFKCRSIALYVLFIAMAATLGSCKAGKYIISKEKVDAQLTNENSRFMEMGDFKAHYRDEGEGAPLVLIHGFGASLHTWEEIKPDLLKHFRVITLDLPGFGLTDYPETKPKPSDLYFTFLMNFFEELGLEKFHLGGNSMGGWIAWEMASRFPEKVDHLILLDAAGYDMDKTNAAAVKLARTKIAEKFARSGLPRWMVRKMVRQAFGKKSEADKATIDRYYLLANRDGNAQSAIHLARNLFQPNVAQISEIEHPTLVLWGTKDRLISVKDASSFHNDLKNSRLIIYQGVGHAPMEEIPKQCARDMINFLTR